MYKKTYQTIDNADELPGWTRNWGSFVFAHDRLFVVIRGREFHATIQNERERGCQRRRFRKLWIRLLLRHHRQFQFQRKACDILYVYITKKMCVFFPLFSLSDNKCTLCLACVCSSARACLRTTRIYNCLSQKNVSVDTLRKVKHESRVLRQRVARNADTVSLGFYY